MPCVGERSEGLGDTYVDLSLADVVGLLKRDEHEGREGHVFLLGVIEPTLGWEQEARMRSSSVCPHVPTNPL